MSFARYPEYKDSGVEWLGEVPGHWEVVRLNTTATCNDEVLLESTAEDYEIEYVEISGVQAGQGITETATLPFGNAPSRARRVVRDGDVLISTVRTYLRAIAQVKSPPENMIASTGFAVLRPRRIDSRFLGYACHAEGFVSEVIARSVGVSYPAINASELARLPIPLPTAPEQTAIATFLDQETAKIDALVAEQEKLIALLQEKRQAVISHAVTKGLDPSVTMKDSGVEWLGEVSVHWEVCALRRVIAAIEQGWSPECYAREAEEQEWGVLKAGCLNGGNFRPSENKALPPELPPEEAYEVRVGDVLMSRASGSPELVGSTALVKATRERLMLSDKIFRLKLKEFVNAAFFVAALNSRPLRIQIENALSGGNGMANNLPQSSLLTFAMAVPPLAEQATITVFLEQETAKLDTLTAEARSAITLLQERRTALISAAVTGQIDVRGLAGSANAPDSVAASAYPASA